MNKKIIFALLLFPAWAMLPDCLIGQSNPQPLFDEANTYLDNGSYLEALSIYRQLEEQDKESGALYLNMGISYVQLDSLGKAKYYFMKAETFRETREAASKGLEYVNSRFSRHSAVLPKLPWQQFFEWLNRVFGAATVLACGIILLNTGIFGYITQWFVDLFNKYLKIGGLSVASIGFLMILASFYLQYIENRFDPAVMIHQQSVVREQPELQAPVVGQAYEGYTFTVDRFKSTESPGWHFVRMSNGLYGWIPESDVRVLDT